MNKRVRRLVLGLAAVLVCVTGLLAVSALVPEIGCENEGNLPAWRLKRNTHIEFSVPEQVEAGQSFSINGTLEKTGWNNPLLNNDLVEPFAYQRVLIRSQHFQQEVMTDAEGVFSGTCTFYQPGLWEIAASYPGDKLENYSASSGYRLIIATGQPVTAGKQPGLSGASRLPFIMATVFAITILALNLIYRRWIMKKQPGSRVPAIPRWVSLVLAVMAVGSLVMALLPRTAPVNYTRQWDREWDVYNIPTMITVETPAEIDARSNLTVEGTLWQRSPGQQEYVPLPGRSIGIFISNKNDSGLSLVASSDITSEGGRFKGKVFFERAGKYTIFFTFSDYSKHYSECRVAKDITVNKEPLFSRWNSPGWLIVYGCLIVILLLTDRLIFSRRRPKNKVTSLVVFRGLPAILAAVEATALVMFMFQPHYTILKWEEANTSLIWSHVTLDVPEKAAMKQPFIIQGTLTTLVDVTEEPLPGQEVTVYLAEAAAGSDRVEQLFSITTDNTGKFAGEVTINTSGHYEVSAVFEKTGGLYSQSGDSDLVTVYDPNLVPVAVHNSPVHSPVIFGVLLFIISTIASFLLGRYGIKWPWHEMVNPVTSKIRYFRTRKIHVPITGSSAPLRTPPGLPSTSLHSPVPQIAIGFPHIQAEMPDVWGKDDSLLIVFSVDGSPQMLAQYSLDIDLEPGTSLRSPITSDGRASRTHIFRQTGVYNIQAVLVKEVRNGYLPASRMVRIVDYREEIVRLYNEMLATLKSQGLPLTSKMTAREVEIKLGTTYPALSVDITKDLVWIFEEANYSLHPIARPAYEMIFKAMQAIMKQARQNGVRHE